MLRRLLFVLGWLTLFLGFAYWIEPGFWRGADGHYATAVDRIAEGDYDAALSEIDAALSIRHDDASLLRARGYVALELGSAEEARRTFAEALEIEPGEPEALLGLAKAEIALGQVKDAQETLSGLPARLETFEQRVERARLLVAAGDLSTAWGRYHALTNEEPMDVAVLEEASSLASMLQRWDEMLALTERLAEATSDPAVHADAVERMAEAAWASGRPERAVELLETVPTHENLEARARLNLELERYDEAADLQLELKALDPGSRKLRTELAYALMRAERLAEAEAEYEQLVAETPEDVDLLLRYVDVLNREGRYPRAWGLVSSLPVPSTDNETHWLQAQTAHWAGESEAAAELLESWSARNPSDPRPYLLLAESRRRMGDRSGRIVALQQYLDRAPEDVETRSELGGILAEAGRHPEAILQYLAVVDSNPADVDVLTQLGALFEATGDLSSALRRYEQAASVSASAPDDLLLRLGRVHAWTGDAEGAAVWYEALLERPLSPDEARTASLELAEALLNSGRPGDARTRISRYADSDPSDAAALLLAARATFGVGDPGATARYLERLGESRPLTAEEARWLAGQQRASGDAAQALETYEHLLSREPDDTELLLAVGDLRFDRDDPSGALEAYERIPAGERPSEAIVGMARARSALADRPAAAHLYEEYLAVRPDDQEVRLELAGVLMLAGRSADAIEHYERYVSVLGEEGIGLDLTRAYLDRQDYESAQVVALRAEERGEDVLQVRLARAQALGGLGEIREADRILRSLVDAPPPPTDPTWAARLAEARNQPLGALLEAQAALRSGAEPAAELHLLQARALGSRGDLSRTLASLERARASGADTARVRRTLDQFRGAWATELEIPALLQEDDGGIRIPQGGASLRFSVADRLRMKLSTSLGRIEQRGVTFDRWVMAITVDRWFPAPEIELNGGIGWEDYRADGGLLVARGAVTRTFARGAEAAIRFERSSLWSAHDEFRPRGFNRVTDAALLGGDFRVHTAAGHVVLRGTAEWETRIEAGVSSFEDGNRQLFAYAHRQIPLVSRQGTWLALRPNLYVDSFSDEVAGYASPTLSTSFGLSLHGMREWSGVRIEADFNPNLLWVDHEWGPGGSGMLDLSVPVGAGRIGGTLFGYLRGPEDYSLWRFMARVNVPVGGGGPR